MFSLNPSYLQRFQHLLIFSAYWLSLCASPLPDTPLSPAAGAVLFIIMDILISLLRRIYLRRTGEGILPFFLAVITVLSVLMIMRGLAALTAGLTLSQDLIFLKIHVYLLLVLPAAAGAQILRYISLRNRIGHFAVLITNLVLFSLIMSRRGWSLHLPVENLIFSYGFIFVFLFLQVLLILSGGRRGRHLALIPALLLIVIPLAGLFPLSRLYKNESRKEGGGLLESSLFRFDFSDYLSLESSISMKDDLVFLMKTEGHTEKTLVRRFVLSAYSEDKGFYRDSDNAPETSDFLQQDFLLGELPHSWDYPEFKMTGTVFQEYYLVNFDSTAFLGFNTPVSVTPYLSWDNSSFSRIYRVDSMVSSAWGWDLLESSAPEADTDKEQAFLEYYTRGGETEDLKELALEITSREFTYYDKVDAVKDYLQDNYSYSLNPGESETGDQLSHFLYVSKKGYCSYFAFSMALLCRSVGIPARVALGFWIDESSQVLGFYPVKANQAHAWVEVFFPEYGWIEFDPTSLTMAEGEEFTMAPFSPREMENYLKEILENRDSLRIPTVSESGESTAASTGILNYFKKRTAFSIVIILLFLSGIYLCIKLLLLYLLLNRIPKKDSAGIYFHLHLYCITAFYRKRESSESVQDYAADLQNEIPLFREFVSQYEKIRFGMSSPVDLVLLKKQGESIRAFLFLSLEKKERYRTFTVLLGLLFSDWRRL